MSPHQQQKIVPQKRKPTKEEYDKMYELRDAIQPFMGAIHLDIKCNSTQSRLQCSLNRFQEFMQKYPERIVAKSDAICEDESSPLAPKSACAGSYQFGFRGGRVFAEIASSRRTFKKKNAEPNISSQEGDICASSVPVLSTSLGNNTVNNCVNFALG